jgi:FecR protein
MRKASGSLLLLSAIAMMASGFAVSYAQERERFVISAKAGGINAVTGSTRVHAPGSSEWELLTIKDNLEAGYVVNTGVDGRLEMLLNPGSYLRVGENSEFELTNNSLDNLEVRLIRGTAIVEATGADDTELMINITTPHTKMAIVRRGLYRVNVVPGDATELIVRKGRVLLSDSQKVKGGKKLIFNGHVFSIAKLEKADKQEDDLDTWSKERSETVAQASRRLTRREMGSLMTSFTSSWFRGYSFSPFGFWFFHPRFHCYTFFPTYGGWGSPYGRSYNNSFYGYYYRHAGYGGPSGYPSGGSSGSGGSQNSGGNQRSSNPHPAQPPPRHVSSPSSPTRTFNPGPERQRATPEIRRPRDQ